MRSKGNEGLCPCPPLKNPFEKGFLRISENFLKIWFVWGDLPIAVTILACTVGPYPLGFMGSGRGGLFRPENKNRPFVSGRKDAVPPDFVSRAVPKNTHSISDNGLTRRKLTEYFRFISTGSRATCSPPHKDLHQTSSLWVRLKKAPPGHSRRNMKSTPFSGYGITVEINTDTQGLSPMRVDCISWSCYKISLRKR